MRGLYALFLGLLCLISCQDIPPVEKPGNFIDENTMESILYESVLISSARGYNVAQLKLLGIQPETYIYDKFDIDSLTYAQNLAYYTADVDLYKGINAKVLARVQAELKVNDSIETVQKKEQDSLRTLKAKEVKAKFKQKDSTKFKEIPRRLVTDTFSRKIIQVKEDSSELD
ncbi:DUF4296 domain-containing protein [uncultured Dokdonia sp.]|uniref:DUF4296 domain-containing protein n=1 Tax=Dokdonia sp. R78006 TaxID=3093866 RepID=UPI00262962EF|nr:DUF4296 domain-containing protein [uncultured Dokdonia sp.]